MKNILIILIIALTTCNIVIICIFNHRIDNYKLILNSLRPYADQNLALRKNFLENIKHIGMQIPENVTLTDTDGLEYSIQSICDIDTMPKLIVRFADNYCSACVEYSVNVIKQLTTKRDDIEVIYIGNSHNINVFRSNIDVMDLKDEMVYNCENLNIDLEYSGFPYYIILDKNAKIKCCYIPTKHFDSFDLENIEKLYDRLTE